MKHMLKYFLPIVLQQIIYTQDYVEHDEEQNTVAQKRSTLH
jgi:hypothetical protein